MPVLGAGKFGAGIAVCGYGVPSPAPPAVGVPFPDPVSGLGQSGYQVDPLTQDYDFTSDGRQIGCPTVKALVEHACSTLFNSSAVAGFGLQLPNGVKGDGFLAQVSARLTNCLSAMVAQGLIAIVSITVANMANPDGTFGLLTWRDLTAPPAGFNASTPSNEYRTPIG